MDKDVLRRLGVTDELIRHLENDDLDYPFGYRCQPALYWQSSPIAARGIVALWECGTVLSYFNQNNRCFEQTSLENIEEIRCSYPSLQGLLAELFIDAYEDEIDNSSDRIRRAVWISKYGSPADRGANRPRRLPSMAPRICDILRVTSASLPACPQY